jgi:hypothetical protein
MTMFRLCRLSPMGLIAENRNITEAWYKYPTEIAVFRHLVDGEDGDDVEIVSRHINGVLGRLQRFPWLMMAFSHWDEHAVMTSFVNGEMMTTSHYLTGHNTQEEQERINVTMLALQLAGAIFTDVAVAELPARRPAVITAVFPSMAYLDRSDRAAIEVSEMYLAGAYFGMDVSDRLRD